MLMPSIALPTGPYDWHGSFTPRATYEQRLARLRDVMQAHGVSHCIVHGNGFDHDALRWLSNFTPKLGPALMLVTLETPPRLLFAGGPGMKPSAMRLTWIEDVTALRSIAGDVAAWLAQASPARLGVITGASILHEDWCALEKAAGHSPVQLDAPIETLRADADDEIEDQRKAAEVLQRVADHLFATASEGRDVLTSVLATERMAYASGAQDVRLRIARRPWGRPTTLPDSALQIAGCRPVALAVRHAGLWAYGDFVLGDISAVADAVLAGLATSATSLPLANRVAFPEPAATKGTVRQALVQVNEARWSGLYLEKNSRREWLFLPPGLPRD